MTTYRFVTLDAFTATPFAGNPCAVLPEASGLTVEQMQQIARETNAPETAFISPSDRADFRVRYFTSRQEIPFAGHPTIATAFFLAMEGRIPLTEPVTTLRLEFNVGVLPVEIEVKNGQPVLATMTQQLPTFGKTVSATETAACFGLDLSDLYCESPVQVVSTGAAFLMVPLASLQALEHLNMDRDRLAALLQSAGVDAAFVFALSGYSDSADTHARLMDPKNAGEDPYTGSAAGAMGSYIVHYGLKANTVFQAEQGHLLGRPGLGVVDIRQEQGEITAVCVSGTAVKVMEGQIFMESTGRR